MKNYITELTKVLEKRTHHKPYDTNMLWSEFEKQYSIILPKDFKDFINFYGVGGINNFIWILNPFEKDQNINFITKKNILLSSYEHSKKQYPNLYPFDIYPSEGGIIPWGFTDNGDELYWKSSLIEDWLIVIYESRSSEYFEYDMSFTEFLYKLVTSQIRCDDIFEEYKSEVYFE